MKTDRIEGLAALAFIGIGIIVLLALYRVPIGTLAAPGMGFFPIVLSILLIILSCILLGRSLRGRFEKGEGVFFGKHWPKLVPVVASLVAYTFLYNLLGYVLATAAFLILVGKLANCSWKVSFLVAFICTFPSYVIFRWYLNIPLPQGLLFL